MFDKPIVMLDFETTGLSPDFGDRVTEVAAVRIVKDKVVDKFVSLINCNIRIPLFISELTGITQIMIDNAPCVSSVIPKLMQFIGNDIISAHNASFDSKFLIAESKRLGIRPHSERMICSLMLSRRIFPGLSSYKLSNVSASLGINFNGNAHRAEADADVAAQILLYISSHLRKKYNVATVDPNVFSEVNKLSAVNVSSFLMKKFISREK